MTTAAGEMKDHAFVVSKPLQLIVALAIITQLEIARSSHVVVVDAFAGARRVCDGLGSLNGAMSGISASCAAATPEAYRSLHDRRFSTLFIDSDVGVRKYLDLLSLRLRNPQAAINVYEEGLGTYRTDLYVGMKERALRFIGAGTRFGGCRLTSALYLYDPAEYERRFPGSGARLVRIDAGPADMIGSFRDELGSLFDYAPPAARSGARCNVYLSNWSVDEPFLRQFDALPGDNYVKPHPHMMAFAAKDHGLVIDPAVPAEIALLDLAQKYGRVNVYHHGSSVERYITSDRIGYIRV